MSDAGALDVIGVTRGAHMSSRDAKLKAFGWANDQGCRKGGPVDRRSALAVAVMALALSACSQTSRLNQGAIRTAPPPASLNPAPLPSVQEGALAPATPTAPNDAGSVPPSPTAVETSKPVEPPKPAASTQVAAATPSAAASQPVTRQSMVGAWTVSTGGSNCQVFLALTKWSGGFRAATRGCSAASIKDVQAWDVKGKQVVLVNSTGATAATLFRSAAERFDGSTTSGGSISFSR